jgi:hypothetical protein
LISKDNRFCQAELHVKSKDLSTISAGGVFKVKKGDKVKFSLDLRGRFGLIKTAKSIPPAIFYPQQHSCCVHLNF